MSRLVWKELREKRFWGLALLASTVGFIAMGRSLYFQGDGSDSWATICTLVAVLMGAGAYSSEIAGESATFLYSRPISWLKVLIAKTLAALAIIAAAAVLSAVAYRLLCPPIYLKFATIARMVEGVRTAILQMGTAYLFGLICSVMLPGTLGGAMVMMGMLVVQAFVAMSVIGSSQQSSVYYWLPYVWTLAVAIAAVLVMRFGISLPLLPRAKRYALYFACAIVPGMIVSSAIPTSLLSNRVSTSVDRSSISADGRYAFVLTSADQPFSLGFSTSFENKVVLLDLWDSKQKPLPDLIWTGRSAYWAGPRTWLPDTYGETLETMRVLPGLRTTSNSIQIGLRRHIKQDGSSYTYGSSPAIRQSPDGRYILVASDVGGKGRTLQFADVFKSVKLKKVITGATDYWWQSNTEVGYTDAKGKRHIVRIIPPEAKQ